MAGSGSDRITWSNYNKKNSRPRMDPENRAKIFLPFNALEGLYEMLQEKEICGVEKTILAEEEAEALNERLMALHTGDLVRAEYYHADCSRGRVIGEYRTEEGILTKINRELGTIRIRKEVISISDLRDIRVIIP